MQKNLAIELRLNNYFYECTICKKWKNAFKDKPYAFTKVVGVQPQPMKIQTMQPVANFTPMFAGDLVCKKCFDDVGMDNTVPKVMAPVPGIVGREIQKE